MSRRVLVVDDDRQMVKTLCDIFRLRGWEADSAFSGEAAVAAVERELYTIVLMDINMPGLSGVEALRAMRSIRPTARIVLMTAYTASELIGEAVREGALRILAKPLAIRELIDLLDEPRSGAGPVLVVDDDRQFLDTIAGVLQRSGYAVRLAAALEEAISLMSEQTPGVVVLDLRLDHVEPRDSILAIKRMNPAVALILCSGYPALLDETARDAPEGWIYARLEKPFRPDRLLELLDAICRD